MSTVDSRAACCCCCCCLRRVQTNKSTNTFGRMLQWKSFRNEHFHAALQVLKLSQCKQMKRSNMHTLCTRSGNSLTKCKHTHQVSEKLVVVEFSFSLYLVPQMMSRRVWRSIMVARESSFFGLPQHTCQVIVTL